MPDVEIRPFSDEHLDAAARLLAERHERHLAAEPLLARDVDYRAQIERALAAGSGVVALVDDELRAYLVGEVTEDDALVDFAGCAARDPELIRDLYASLAANWGRDRHRVYVPASEAGLIDAWFRLAFGFQFAYGVRATGAESHPDPDVDVRPGTPADLDAAAALADALWAQQRSAPSFSARTPASLDDKREQWRDTWDDPQVVHFVADRGGQTVGHLLLYRRPQGDLRVPADNIDLAHASVTPDARGSGVGLALTMHALDWAKHEGFRSMTVDWREVNLLAARFWRRRGFRPTFLRLYRHIP
jgi:ribosomal protein S18 acetylase RimI-like enzyme